MEQTWADYIFGGGEGIICVGLYDKKAGVMRHSYFEWPKERDDFLKVKVNRKRYDLYFCPSLFYTKSAKKSQVKGSFVSWVDLDGPLHEYPEGVEEAGLVVASGGEEKTHRYWRATEFLDVTQIEAKNLWLTQTLGSDESGWDANQLLRIPETFNHKTEPPGKVRILSARQDEFCIPQADVSAYTETSVELLGIEEVLFSRTVPRKIRELYIEGPADGDRSKGLAYLGLLTAEAGYSESERYTILHHADLRWGKFKLRDDKEHQLSLILKRTRMAGSLAVDGPSSKRSLFSRRQLLTRPKSQIQWIYEGLLSAGSFVVLAGKQGVGKSQLALQLGSDIVLKRSFLDYPYAGKGEDRVLWFSLEMTDDQLAHIVDKQLSWVAPNSVEDRELEDRLAYDSRGYAAYLEKEEGQKELEEWIAEFRPTGIVIDSLSAAVETSLKDDAAVRKVFDWIDNIRVRYGVWVVLVSHPRKQPAGTKVYESTVDDIYGDSIITQRPSVVLNLSTAASGQLTLQYLKNRSAPIGSAIFLRRSDSLLFSVEEERVLTPTARRTFKKGEVREVEFDTDGI